MQIEPKGGEKELPVNEIIAGKKGQAVRNTRKGGSPNRRGPVSRNCSLEIF